MEYKKQSHCIYCCDYHIVIITKYRRKIFNKGIFKYFDLKLKEIRKHYPELEIKEVNHDKDHIHLLISIPPKMSVGSVVRIIKSNTTKNLRKKFSFLNEVYWGTSSVWSASYFVSTIGINQATIQKYIQHQGEEDVGQAKLEL